MGFYSIISMVSAAQVGGWIKFGASALIILGVLVIVHEFGHFIVARMVGVPVEKFAVGFGRRIYGRKLGETEYMVCAVPLGGYVKFYGDDGEEKESETHPGYSFLKEPVWKRLCIVVAGPMFNLILAVFVFASVAMLGQFEPDGDPAKDPAVLAEIIPGYPAHKAGLKEGDLILEINGVPTPTWMAFRNEVIKYPDKLITLLALRGDGKREKLVVTPKGEKALQPDGSVKMEGRLGVGSKVKLVQYPPHTALVMGAQATWASAVKTVWVISKLITGVMPANLIAGPIGILQVGGAAAAQGLTHLLGLVAFISVNLGIINLMPIPVLDGGHIFFFTLEAALGKPLSMRNQEIAQNVGIIMLLSLMALAFYNDLTRLIAG